MVVGLDNTVGGAALARHVAVEREVMLVGYVLFFGVLRVNVFPSNTLCVLVFFWWLANNRNQAAL